MPASSRRALYGALAANLAIAAVKFLVGILTHSTVMITEGIHSLVDTGNSSLMLLGESRSRRPADEQHPFGYGMELYFWSFVVAMVVFGGGGGISVYEGIRAMFHPRELTRLWPNYLVIGASAIFEGISLAVGLREFAAYRRERRFEGSAFAVMRASKNPAIFVTVLEDAAALIGLGIAALGLTSSRVLGLPVLEGIASVLIGVVLMAEALLLGFECRGLIIGEAARPLVISGVRRVLARHPEVGTVDAVRTLQLGPDAVMLILHVRQPVVPAGDQLRAAFASLVTDIQAEIPVIRDVAFASSAASPP
jgi:cation diffusion facilitator family transporter